MKKLLAALLMLAVVSTLNVCAFAASRGVAYIEDNGYYDERVSETTPGGTVYIALVEAVNVDTNSKISSKMVPTTAKITSAKTLGYVDDKDYKLIKTGNLDIEKLEVEDGGEWYFAVLKVKDIDIDDYPEDGFAISGTLKVTRKSGSTFTIDLSNTLDFIRFSEADDEDMLGKQVQLYNIDGGDEFELEFPNEKGRFCGEARSDIEVLAAMNHTKISAITKLDRSADMTFYIGNGAKFSNIREGQLIIEADNGDYLYKIGTNNKLTNMTSAYDEDEDAFVIETNVLGQYVVSDERLSTSGSSSDDDDDDDIYTYYEDDDDDDDDKETYVSVPLINPPTGAAV